MNSVGLNNTDILLDSFGQPIASKTGDFETVSNAECWKQDLELEMGTDAGELFYEDERGRAAYGYSLTDFLNQEFTDFNRLEISQRIQSKLSKRQEVDERTIIIKDQLKEGSYQGLISFKTNSPDDEYNIDLSVKKTEVVISD